MTRRAYYESLMQLAREKREKYGVSTHAFGLRELRVIYKEEGIRLDQWPLPRKVKALYMCDEGDCSVAVQPALPYEPKLFALVHELKHHYCDQAALGAGVIHCGDYDANELIEKGAEVFAAEFIYPEAGFASDWQRLNVAHCEAINIVTFKRSCEARVSYHFIRKRLERLGIITLGQFDGVQFQKLEDQIYGVPFYRQRRQSLPKRK